MKHPELVTQALALLLQVMRMLVLIRNFVPAYQQIINDDWNVAEVAVKSWDIKVRYGWLP